MVYVVTLTAVEMINITILSDADIILIITVIGTLNVKIFLSKL